MELLQVSPIGVQARGAGARRLEQNHYFSSKTTIFWAKDKFFRQKSAVKMRKIFLLYLLNEQTQFILSSEIKCPKSGIFTNSYWVG